MTAKVTIEITDNGYIRIDASDAAAKTLGIYPYTTGSDDRIKQIALAFGSSDVGHTLRRMDLRGKRGVSNHGWTATFIDTIRRDRFIKEHG